MRTRTLAADRRSPAPTPPSGRVRRRPLAPTAAGSQGPAQKREADPAERFERAARGGHGPAAFEVASVNRQGGSGGPLPGPVRAKMERALGADFSDVRVHQGPQATSIGAIAYTRGRDIHFRPGAYEPGSDAGRKLLGHELTHVIQQRQGRVAVPRGAGLPVNADPGLEKEAESAGDRVAQGPRTNPLRTFANGTSRERGVPPIQGMWGRRLLHTLKNPHVRRAAFGVSALGTGATMLDKHREDDPVGAAAHGASLIPRVGPVFGVGANLRDRDYLGAGLAGASAIPGPIGTASMAAGGVKSLIGAVPPVVGGLQDTHREELARRERADSAARLAAHREQSSFHTDHPTPLPHFSDETIARIREGAKSLYAT